jgi:Fe-S-cluster-containing dehydrogenase component
MHCDNPPCSKLCPFGVNHKMKEGPVYIENFLCFGGAKCRTVCPWDVPQRQAGVGIYTYLQPLPVGGGVMFKCDSCKDRLLVGEKPYCESACPNNAILFGKRKNIFEKALKLKEEYNGYIYGLEEHKGTSTLYISKIPFEKIDKAILENTKNKKKAMRMHKPKNIIDEHSALAKASKVHSRIHGYLS